MVGHEDEYVEVDPETREILIPNPGSCHVHVGVRRKFILKIKPKKEECPFITAPLAPWPLVKSYADATLFTGLMIGKLLTTFLFIVRPKCSVPWV